MSGHVATAQVTVDAPVGEVWDALTNPDTIAAYMFGSRVETDWTPGSPITWNGEWEGKPYQDKGEVLQVVANERLQVTHFSPLTGQEDVPENYHKVTYELAGSGGQTSLTLSQDGNGSEDEAAHSGEMWQTMLDGLKTAVEGAAG